MMIFAKVSPQTPALRNTAVCSSVHEMMFFKVFWRWFTLERAQETTTFFVGLYYAFGHFFNSDLIHSLYECSSCVMLHLCVLRCAMRMSHKAAFLDGCPLLFINPFDRATCIRPVVIAKNTPLHEVNSFISAGFLNRARASIRSVKVISSSVVSGSCTKSFLG